jgi:hypothetical protein
LFFAVVLRSAATKDLIHDALSQALTRSNTRCDF